jgi:hypothetical protein
MIGRRALADLLGELAESATAFADAADAAPVRVRSMSIDLPIDLRLAATADGPQVLGDVPLFRMRTAFDPDPARLQVEWHAIPLDWGPLDWVAP